MKNLQTLILISISLFALDATAQDDIKIQQQKQDSSYCLVMKDGMTVLTTNAGKEIHTDVTLENGTKISPTGNIVKKDGTQKILKEGECISNSGETLIGSAPDKKEKMRMGPKK
jgi:hypothetical protein